MAMRFTIDGEKLEFDQHRLMNVEAIAIRRVTAMTLPQWNEALSEVDPTAVTALVWIIQKRQDPELQFEDVVFNLMEFAETLEADEETDAESDPTDSTPTPEPLSDPSPTSSESESGSSLS